MPLEDFFAKKDKKKSKKKHNPQELIERLTKNTVSSEVEDVPSDVGKATNVLRDDDWALIDDEEKDIDLQNIRIGKLAVDSSDEPAKLPSKDKHDKGLETSEDKHKTVWGGKQLDKPVIEEPKPEPVPEPEPAPEPQPVQPKVYVPVHLRDSGDNGPKSSKPNFDIIADFPTLDDAGKVEQSSKKADDDGSWTQAGIPRKPTRAPDMLPIVVNTTSSAYVPPSLRQNVVPFQSARTDVAFDSREVRFRDSIPSRHDSSGIGRRSDFSASRDLGSVLQSPWSRGEAMKTGPTSHSSYTAAPSAISRPAFNFSDSGWEKGANIKTFKETEAEKKEFELTQSNRFAGLSGI